MDLLTSNQVLLIVVIVLLIFIVPTIFFFLTQQNTLKAIQPQNRLMSPGEVWLQFIPLFNLVWQFIVVNRIADSIEAELDSENKFSFEDSNTPSFQRVRRPTAEIGIASCVLRLCGIIPVIGVFAALAGIICWIIYWVKLADYKRQIESKNYSRSLAQL